MIILVILLVAIFAIGVIGFIINIIIDSYKEKDYKHCMIQFSLLCGLIAVLLLPFTL